MEAPEKIYILKYTDYLDRRILNAFTEKKNNNDIEYIRTDAFIKKACEWLGEHLMADYWSQRIASTDYFIEKFKKAMEE